MQYELSLSDYWRILRKRHHVVWGAAIIMVAGSIFYLERQTPIFQTASQIKLERPNAVTGQIFRGFQSYHENPMETESRVIESRAIAEVVANNMDPSLAGTDLAAYESLVSEVQGSITAEPVLDTNLINITVKGPRPQRTALIANLAAQAYIEFNLREKNKQARKVRQFVEDQLLETELHLRMTEEAIRKNKEYGDSAKRAQILESRRSGLMSTLDDLSSKLTDRHPDIIRLRAQISQVLAELKELPSAELEMERLMREKAVNEGTYRTLRQRLEEARIAEAEKIADAAIIETAGVPGRPIYPKKRMGVMIGGLLGLIVGCVLAFVFEATDTSIGTIEEIEALLQVPVLAILPHFGNETSITGFDLRARLREALPFVKQDRKRWGQVNLYAHHTPHSPTTEACRILRTNLQLSPEKKVILLTSAGPGEGKTTLISNLGIVTAQSGLKTILVSCDLRRPALSRAFELSREDGVAEVLRGEIKEEKAIKGLSDFILGKFGYDEAVKNPYLANLSIMTAGHIPENPAELLGSQAMKNLIASLREKYDVILLDAPPILPVTDSVLIAPQVDGVVLVYQVGRISRGALVRAKMQLDAVGSKLLGVALNHVRPEVQTQPRDYYVYKQKYAYREEPEEASSD